jgi:dephospho-CoA kinase
MMHKASQKHQSERFIVGLTGGIGSGKSAASQAFIQLGIDVIDADIVARVVVAPGTPALEKIAELFGTEVLEHDGSLNRKFLRQKIFANSSERQRLENVLHPVIREEILRRLENSRSAYTVLSSPLLFETGQDSLVDRILLIDASEETQMSRALARDNTDAATISAIMASQWPRAKRREHANDIIVNEGSLRELEEAVVQLHKKYMSRIVATPVTHSSETSKS